MAAKLGDFFVNITTKADNKGIKETATGLDDLIGKAKKLAATYLSFQAAKGLINADRAIIKDAAELGRLSGDLGIATEQLEQFGRAFEIVGAGADEAYSTIRGLTKLIPSLQMGDEGMAEAFGILGIGAQNLTNDQLENFDTIRKRFSQLNSAQQLYFVNTIGLGEKSLRVLRLNDEEYQNLLETAKEAPLLNPEQKERAESYTRMESRAGISKDATLRRGAIATAPTLEKIPEKILEGTKFINAVFSDSKTDAEKAKIIKQQSFEDKINQSIFLSTKQKNNIINASKRENKIADFFGKASKSIWEQNKKVFFGEISMRKDADKSIPQDARNREIERQIPQSWNGNKSVIINNNFQNKTDVQIKEAKDLQKDLTKHIPNIVDEVFSTSMKQASENFKGGVLQ